MSDTSPNPQTKKIAELARKFLEDEGQPESKAEGRNGNNAEQHGA